MTTSETLDFVSSTDVGRLSRVVVSRVEARSFSRVRLNSCSESLRQFDDIFSNPDLRSLVKTISYDVVLPVVSDKRLKNKFQSRREVAENSAAFTQAILELFTRLSSWQQYKGVDWSLTATSPSDDPILRSPGIKVKYDRNHFKYIGIDDSVLPPGGLPSVPCISSFNFENLDCSTSCHSDRMLHPDVICAIARALPCLENAAWETFMPPRRMASQRQEVRAALAQVFLRPAFPSLASLNIRLRDHDPRNELAELESFVQDGAEDDLSLGIRRVSQLSTLVTLNLNGKWIISPQAFGAFGPLVASVFISVSSTTPDGKWLLDYDPSDLEEDEEDEDDAYSESWDSAEAEDDVLLDLDSENSDVEDRLPEKAEAMANLDLPSKEVRFNPNSELFTPLLVSIANAVAKSTSTSLRDVRMDFSAALAALHLIYLGVGEQQHQGFTYLSRPTVGDKPLERPKWYIDGSGGIAGMKWKVPAELRRAMEEKVGKDNIDGYTDSRTIEME
ncbi:hypothetical protein QBC33DRAFT_551683 [Phialemonium atrogriseum]|uniref:Uncharacterized protein n=1 Tax=Phialemonium atrogriseum TaxID=1093897 RepID=A0AAJ0BSW0_9PEZI|nr:uncharacterized protein QBC33DRAFT_551683 [Phialemonium atrogriseum]KAK1762484.1 hypothetical protein QBC33DRAFT_551683 [Phialemonium atrogriseum]